MAERTIAQLRNDLAKIEGAVAAKWGLLDKTAAILSSVAESPVSSEVKTIYLKAMAKTRKAILARRYDRMASGFKIPAPRLSQVIGGPADLSKIDVKSGYSEPLRLFDTHPNRRFATGDKVMFAGGLNSVESVHVVGRVIGHIAEDRLMIRWPTHVAQVDVDDVMGVGENNLFGSVEDSKDVLPADISKNSQMVASTRGRESKEYDPNPWAVCTESVGRDNPDKYERCVHDVKDKQSSKVPNPKTIKEAACQIATCKDTKTYLVSLPAPLSIKARKMISAHLNHMGHRDKATIVAGFGPTYQDNREVNWVDPVSPQVDTVLDAIEAMPM